MTDICLKLYCITYLTFPIFYLTICSDRFVNRAEQVAKHAGMVQANRPPVDELAGVRMFKEAN